MLSAFNVSPSKAAGYYTREDSINSAGQWFGKGAEHLGLTGTINQQDFRDVLYGHSPGHTVRLRQRHKSYQATPTHGRTIVTQERAATDLTFSAPKSVSIVGLVQEDHRVISAHQDAVTSILTTIESEHLRTRAQINRRPYKIQTDNLIAATFVHRTSRTYDPQLHSHCLVMNTTQRPDGKWRTLENTEFFKTHLVSLSIDYRKELAQNLQHLGYEITWGSSHCFEIASVHPALITAFSSRRKAILKASKHSSSRGARQVATFMTRGPKHRDQSLDLQIAVWKRQATNVLSQANRTEPIASVDPIASQQSHSLTPQERPRKYIPLRKSGSGPSRGLTR